MIRAVTGKGEKMDKKILITIGYHTGASAKETGKKLAEKLGIPYYDNSEMAELLENNNDVEFFKNAGESVPLERSIRWFGAFDNVTEDMFNEQRKITRKLASEGSAVFVGRCSDYVLKEFDGLVKVFLDADEDTKINNICKDFGISVKDARRHIKQIDKSRKAFYEFYTNQKWGDAGNYDLCIDTTGLSEEAVEAVILAYCGITE